MIRKTSQTSLEGIHAVAFTQSALTWKGIDDMIFIDEEEEEKNSHDVKVHKEGSK